MDPLLQSQFRQWLPRKLQKQAYLDVTIVKGSSALQMLWRVIIHNFISVRILFRNLAPSALFSSAQTTLKCGDCGCGMKSREKLLQHDVEVHPGKSAKEAKSQSNAYTSLKCTHCRYTASGYAILRTHMRKHSGMIFVSISNNFIDLKMYHLRRKTISLLWVPAKVRDIEQFLSARAQ